jgi:DNA-binding CsgD family transcriptional regulator
VCCVVGDGEAETGPLATSWHGTKFLSARHDGAVLPVLHLDGYKIANPTVLARIPENELRSLLEGYGWRPLFVSGDVPADVHGKLAAALDEALDPPCTILWPTATTAVLLAYGHTNRDVAAALQVSVRTAEAERAHVMRKLGLERRAELVRWALERGLLR